MFLGLTLLLLGCPEEDESLLRPDAYSNTVFLRLINFANDSGSRHLKMYSDKGFEGETESVEVFNSSTAINPPDDSCMYELYKGNSLDYVRETEGFFVRNSFVTLVALPAAVEKGVVSKIDTLIDFTYADFGIESIDKSKVKVLNAINDTLKSYTIYLGCPGSEILIKKLQYKALSPSKEIRADEGLTITLVKNVGDDEEVLNTYSFDTEGKGVYTFIVAYNEIGEETVYLLDEKKESSTALMELVPIKIEDKNSNLRLVNLSKDVINVFRNDEEIFNSVSSNYISEWTELSACQSKASSTYTNSLNADDKLFTSLNVYQDYTLIYYDSLEITKSMLIKPDYLYLKNNNGCSFKIINLNENYPGLSVSSAAHSYWLETDTVGISERNFKTGDTYDRELKYGEESEYREIEAGVIPFTIFSSTSPTELEFTCLQEFESGKSYIMIITEDASEMIKITFIESSNGNSAVDYSDEGVFMQVVNAHSLAEHINIDLQSELGNLLFDAKIHYESSIATVIDAGSRELIINGETYNFDAVVGDEVMLIITSRDGKIEMLDHSSALKGNDNARYTRRFINASSGIEQLNIYDLANLTGEEKTTIVTGLGYGVATPLEEINREVKLSFQYEDNISKEELSRNDDLFLTLGKNYTIIFTGDEENGYTALIQQGF